MAEDAELAQIRARRLAEMQSQVWSSSLEEGTIRDRSWALLFIFVKSVKVNFAKYLNIGYRQKFMSAKCFFYYP